MKLLKSGFLIFVLLLLNCGDDGPPLLEIGLSPRETFLIPGGITFFNGSGLPCYNDGEIEEPRFTVNTVKTLWRGEGTFEPTAVILSFTGKNGLISDYKCGFSGTGDNPLGEFLGFGDGTKTLPAGNVTPQEKNSTCSIFCGGVEVLNENVGFNVEATVKMFGVQTVTNSDGTTTDKPVSAKKNIRVTFLR